LTWQGAIWGAVDGVIALYEGSNISTYYVFDRGKVGSRLLGTLQVQEEEKVHSKMGISGCSHIVGTVEI
jgi:hypothetical protein